ncbi:MAG: hypothetical protein RL517_719 [Pseudomonadota bacterium]
MVVGVQGFEPWTPCSQSRCATRLRYTPTEPIFYTEMVQRGKSCKITAMRALFLSKLNKQYRGWIALIILLTSLLGTHWIGFAHGIAHSGIHHQSIELSCADQEPSLGHSSANCHLLDALSLAGFIASDSSTFGVIHSSSESLEGFSNSPPARLHVGLYQSRAPPAFIL